MGSKGHLYLSLGKSFFRLVSFGVALPFALISHVGIALSIVIIGNIAAEILGIAEEFADERGMD